ncbi:cytochrome P450, partial [Lentinula aciculospora]
MSVEQIAPFIAGFFLFISFHFYPLRGDTAFLMCALLSCGFLFVLFLSATQEDEVFITGAQSISLCALVALVMTVLFRLSPLHPLHSFPGPLLNRISSLPSAYTIYTGYRHLTINSYHEKYGDFVRTGPNTLSINSYAAVSAIYSSASAMDKSSAYDFGGMAGLGLFFTKEKKSHSQRRRQWARAFTKESVNSYQPVLMRRTMELMDCIMSRKDSFSFIVNISECINHWTYDIMGDIIFGRCNKYSMMLNGDPGGLIQTGNLAIMLFECLSEIPPLSHILWHLPVAKRMRILEEYAGNRIVEFQKNHQTNFEKEFKPLASYFASIEDDLLPNSKDSKANIQADSLFAIQAGSDTPSGVAILLVFLILSNKSAQDRLVDELDREFPPSHPSMPVHKLIKLPYLNAVIHEALRLGTPFGGFPRVVPTGGFVINGKFVPGNTIVSIPTYTQEILEQNFSPHPLLFRPERWLSNSAELGFKTNRNALMSFSYGPYGCLGKELAWNQLLLFTARLFSTYEVKFTSDFIPSVFMKGVKNLRAAVFDHDLKVVV